MTRGFRSELDLFGRREDARGGIERNALVDLTLVCLRTSAAAWLLSPDGGQEAARWLPFSQGQRGEGPDASVWTMPKWIAVDRGWV